MLQRTTLTIPEPGRPITADELLAIERNVVQYIPTETNIDRLEEVRAKARALEEYLRSKGMQGPMLGVQRRVEARIGQLLGAAKPGPKQSPVVTGVSEEHRSDFRIIAKAFEKKCKIEEKEWRKSRRALVSLVRNRLGILPELKPLPPGKFRCIIADPPWQLDTGPDAWGTTGESGHDALAYEQMSVDAIKRMAVEQSAADDAHLYLWTTNKYVEASYDVARAWGFKPSVLLVWCKEPRGVGLGDAFRLTTEFVLYARRGSLKEKRINPTTWYKWPRGKHSRKPDDFYKLVESMTPGRDRKDRLELFGRPPHRKGWTVWGEEAQP